MKNWLGYACNLSHSTSPEKFGQKMSKQTIFLHKKAGLETLEIRLTEPEQAAETVP